MPLYVVYGSISAPIRNSPRSVCEMYTWSCEDTMITSRNGFIGSVTNAWRMCVVIGSRTPREPGDERRPAGGGASRPARTRCGRAVVSTATMRSPFRSKPVTSVSGWISTPSSSRRARIPPDDRVVADDPARRVVERAHDRVRRPVGDVELRAELLDSLRVDDARLDPEQLVHLGALLHRHERAIRVREREVPVLGEHEVEVELARRGARTAERSRDRTRRLPASGSSSG